jgi:hypothetical protein
MVRRFIRVVRASALIGILGGAIAFGLSSCKSGTTADCGDANAAATRQDGQCCMYSLNCQAGSICNDPMEDLYDATKPMLTCVKVVCQSDSDCLSPKKCTLEKVCNAPVCQTDSQCTPGTACIGGACTAAPSASLAMSCAIVTPNQAIKQGAMVDLAAVAKNANGAVLPHIAFSWSAMNPMVVTINGSQAVGGSQAGATLLTAKVVGNESVNCSGVTLTNYPTVGPNMARVVLSSQKDGTPVAGASVTVMAGGMLTAMTDSTGAATVMTSAPIDSITVEAAGYQSTSVLSPGTNDIYLPMAIVPDATKAGGFRGTIDLSATKPADIQLGIAGPAIPNNILDFQLTSLLGDSVHTVIDAPELSLNNKDVNLPGGIMLGLGNKKFTVDYKPEMSGMPAVPGVRCEGEAPTANQLGCYVARAPAGATAA